jgi:hypothetical protein
MYSLALSLLIIFVSAYYDYKYLQSNYIYSHFSRSIIRAFSFLLLALYSVTGAIGGVLLFAALFDGLLNKLRGLDLFYLGNTAEWDKFFNKRPVLYICVKVICLFIGIYLCLK